MKKKFFMLVFMLVMVKASALYAQDQVPAGDEHSELITPLWEMIAFGNYKHNYNSQNKWVPVFSPQIKVLNNKTVTLPGYIVAIKAGMTHDLFMLSVLPVAQCAFCGAGSIPPMVEVHMKEGIRFTDRPVEIRGKLVLNGSGNLQSEFYLMNAEQIKTL